MSKNTPDIQAIIDEAQDDFDLDARLSGNDRRSGSTTVYSDSVTGDKHQKAEQRVARLEGRQALSKVEGSEVEWTGNDTKELNAAKKERDELLEKVKLSGLTLDVQWIPPIAADVADRLARKALGIKGLIPEDRGGEFAKVSVAAILSQGVTRVVDHKTGKEHPSLSFGNARALVSYLPTFEFEKINNLLGDLQLRNVISSSVTDDPDF